MTKNEQLAQYETQIDEHQLRDRAMFERYQEVMTSTKLSAIDSLHQRSMLLSKMAANISSMCRLYIKKDILIKSVTNHL
jgi:butyrate kinase